MNDLEEYLAAFEENPTFYAAVPPQLVAEYLGVSHAAVMRKLTDGKLTEIKIGKNRLVAVSSILAMNKHWSDQCGVVQKTLEGLASRGRAIVFYNEVMSPIGLKTTIPADRNRIGAILGHVSEISHDQHGVLLSVLVHRSTQGTTKPGPGFFELAESLGYECQDKNAFVEKETKRVIAAYTGKA